MSSWTALAVPDARRRQLENRSGPQGREIHFEGERLLNFCSNDYLGLANDPRLVAASHAALARYGVGSGAAALLSGWTEAHAALCVETASFVGRDRALLFSSGYLANLGLLRTFADRHTEIFHDRLNHASLIDGVLLSGGRSTRYRHADTDDLARKLEASRAARKIIVTDSVFSMDGDEAPVAVLATLARRHQALLICDDAHGFGVLGGGRGYLHAHGLTQTDVPLVMVTFGKALGAAGAAVAGSADLIEALLQHARTFIYDTALPAVVVAAASAGIDLLRNDPEPVAALVRNITLFKTLLADEGLPVPTVNGPIQPIILGTDDAALAAAAALRKRGLYVRAVRPPTVPEGTARLRICLSGAHAPADIEQLVAALSALQFDRTAQAT